jgi:hypothetical protein
LPERYSFIAVSMVVKIFGIGVLGRHSIPRTLR